MENSPLRATKAFVWRLFLGFTLAVTFSCSTAHAWWNSEWTLRKKIILDTSSAGAGINNSIGTAPVLVRLYDGNFRFMSAKADGSDLRFVAEDEKTLLNYHIEKFDPLLNEAFVWIKVPDIKPGAKTTFWMYYGNGGNKAVKVEDSKGTYDDSTILVYHFSEHGQPAYDFTEGGNNALNAGSPSDGALIGTGLRLDGKTAVTIPPSSALTWSAGTVLTWSAWAKYVAPQPNGVIFSRRASGRAFLIGVDSGVPYIEVRDANGVQRTGAGAVLPVNSWHNLAVSASDQKITLYLDGEVYAALVASLPALDGSALLGSDSVGSGFAGEIDELEISKTARSQGAIKFLAINEGTDGSSKLISFGEDEQQTSWLSALKTGYVGVIIGSLSVDGWVVIGILGIMSVISWVVMIAKATYLNRISKGNSQFLKEWSHVATDLSVLENGNGSRPNAVSKMDAVKVTTEGPTPSPIRKTAPLYHIYHIGVAEIQHRLSAEQSAQAKVLSGRSIQAIRASLDAGLVRETQKLNSQMVLLTIAISGGPFLGLLGTVVGVMITFAAVAQAGDVNVNAIAPGIAAALAATVAGLAVAIPALFGYNYLLTRIKSTSTDMHVFIDEFVTKLAEFYSLPEA